jgi:hypothetical protein
MCETHRSNNIVEKIVVHRKRCRYFLDKTVTMCPNIAIIHLHDEEKEEGQKCWGEDLEAGTDIKIYLQIFQFKVGGLTLNDMGLIFHSTTISRPALGHIMGTGEMTLGIKRQKRECGYKAPIFTKVQNVWNFSSTLPYPFMILTFTDIGCEEGNTMRNRPNIRGFIFLGSVCVS